MQMLICMHTPVYKKNDANTMYELHVFYKLVAAVHPNAPIMSVWDSLLKFENLPAVVLVSGNKTIYGRFDDTADGMHEVWDFDFSQNFTSTRGHDDCRGGLVVQNESSILFTEAGLLLTLPVPDRKERFLASFAVSTMKQHAEFSLNKQKQAFRRLRDNFQFVSLSMQRVVDCTRIENGRVQKKRKRNTGALTSQT